MPALIIHLYFQTIRSEGVNPPFFKLYIPHAMKGLKKIKGKRGLDNLFPKSGKATPKLPTLSSRAPSDKTGCPILNFAFFAKFRVGMLKAYPNERSWGPVQSSLTRHRMPHPWQFHGWAAVNSPLACPSVTAKLSPSCYIVSMSTNLHGYYGAGYLHFITTSEAAPLVALLDEWVPAPPRFYAVN